MESSWHNNTQGVGKKNKHMISEIYMNKFMLIIYMCLVGLTASLTGMCTHYWWHGIIEINILICCVVLLGIATSVAYLHIKDRL